MILSAIDTLDSAIRAWGEQQNWPAEHVLRLLLACVVGGLVGLERELRGRQAGFRTNLLVCVGSALVMIVSVSFAQRQWPHQPNVNLNIDPARIAYGIMTGIGFLGAGTIIKHESSVRGLTTAAAMWCVAAVGMAAGFGMYSITIIATTLILVALWFLELIADGLPRTYHRVIVVRRLWTSSAIEQTVERIKSMGIRVNGVTFQRTGDLVYADISVRIAIKDRQLYYALQKKIDEDGQYQLLATRDE
jgi:putative Mg2+ transporter-C (MgtC) family protein